MVPASKKRENSTKNKPFPFLRLPLELRVIIYRHAVIKEGQDSYLRELYTLKPCALTQVNRQVRAEVLPIFYGENNFSISLPCDDPSGEDDFLWHTFHRKLSLLSRHGGLAYIGKLDVMYKEDVWEDSNNFLLGFTIMDCDLEDDDQPKDRIGSDQADWNDEQAVEAAFHGKVEQKCKYYMENYDMALRCPISRIAAVLAAFAKLCPDATAYVELIWDYGH